MSFKETIGSGVDKVKKVSLRGGGIATSLGLFLSQAEWLLPYGLGGLAIGGVMHITKKSLFDTLK